MESSGKMDRQEWKKRIIDACKKAGTFRDEFESVIDTLSTLMETRDAAQAFYEADGARPIVTQFNKEGHPYTKKNPALAVVQDCNQQALAYWRDLGLTPSGFKKLDRAPEPVKLDAFAEMLAGIGI